MARIRLQGNPIVVIVFIAVFVVLTFFVSYYGAMVSTHHMPYLNVGLSLGGYAAIAFICIIILIAIAYIPFKRRTPDEDNAEVTPGFVAQGPVSP
jgi:amino acid transporter